MKYQGQDVTLVRPAQAGEPGHDAAKEDQVVIRMSDGAEKVVERKELSE